MQKLDLIIKYHFGFLVSYIKILFESSKRRGIRGGRPRAIDDEKMIVIKKALEDGMSKATICRTFGVKRSTLIDSLNRS